QEVMAWRRAAPVRDAGSCAETPLDVRRARGAQRVDRDGRRPGAALSPGAGHPPGPPGTVPGGTETAGAPARLRGIGARGWRTRPGPAPRARDRGPNHSGGAELHPLPGLLATYSSYRQAQGPGREGYACAGPDRLIAGPPAMLKAGSPPASHVRP